MSPEKMNEGATGAWREVLGLIDTLLSEPMDAREKLLANLAASRPDLHVRVRALLDADAQATRVGFMSVRRDTRGDGTAALQVGARLGCYRIVSEIGQGGMGEVWLARRDDGLYEGEVAIKTLHPFFAHGAMRERFLREAQLLGKLAHPNIARLLDAGVDDGVVFIVLEFVDGEPIDVYCDARSLDIDARVRIFVDVCAAVAHAHANLVVHRDIKPSNILVTPQGQVKLLDFGIGKLMESDTGAARTELTRITGRIFTPEFAAPEQILGEPVTTATDVYSLGTLLYVLLAGVRPFGGDISGARAEHAVLHEEPVALSRAGSQADGRIATLRGTTPHRLQRVLANDLEDIVHLALRKLPMERYGSVLALREDLARYTRHEPVAARAGSRAYRMNRFVRRHRVAVAATAGVLLAATLGVVGVLYQAREAREQARVAKLETAKATAVKDFIVDIFNANSDRNPEGARGRVTTAEDLLVNASRKILLVENQDPEVRDELLDVLGNLSWYLRHFEQAEALYLERIKSIRRDFGVTDPRQAKPLLDLSFMLRKRERIDESVERAEEAIAILTAAGQQDSLLGGRALMEAAMARYLKSNRKGTEVYAQLQESIRVMEKFPATPALASAYLSLGSAYEVERRFDEAIVANQRGLELAIRTSAPLSDLVAGAHLQLARAYAGLFRFAEAEEQYAKAIEVGTFVAGMRGQTTLESRTHMANMMTSRGKYRAAVKETEEVLALQLDGNESEGIPHKNTRFVLGRSLAAIGDFDRARVQLDAAEATTNRLADKRGLPVILHARAEIALDQQRPADALKDVELAAAIIATAQGPKSLTAARNLLMRGEALVALRRFDEARAVLGDAAKVFVDTERDPARGGTLQTRLAMASIDLGQGRPEVARKEIAAVLEQLIASNRRADLWILEERAHRQLAAAQLASGQRQEACKSLDAAIALRDSNALPTDPRLAAARALKATCTA